MSSLTMSNDNGQFPPCSYLEFKLNNFTLVNSNPFCQIECRKIKQKKDEFALLSSILTCLCTPSYAQAKQQLQTSPHTKSTGSVDLIEFACQTHKA